MSDSFSEDIAGQYVLGALDAAEMAAVRRDAMRDPGLAAEIAMWERRLAPLAALAGEVAPPAAVWESLQARLFPPPARRRALWQAAAIGAMAMAASVAGFLVGRTQLAPPRVAVLLPLEKAAGGWLVELQPNGRIRAVAQGNVGHAADRDFELWALPARATRPLPLGLLPVAAGSAELAPGKLPPAFRLLVSLEPKGGSPTGLPTGPVLFGGDVGAP